MMHSQLKEVFEAAKKCSALNVPFVLFSYPGEKEYTFFADPIPDSEKEYLFVPMLGAPDSEGFFINMFDNGGQIHPAVIEPTMSAQDVLATNLEKMPEAAIHPSDESTSPEVYDAEIVTVTSLLNSRREKCVISRCINLTDNENPVNVAYRYFQKNPSCFRFMYFTRDTGLWFGATPELLVDMDILKGELHTVSLAGTRDIGTNTDWDEKNRLEHEAVTDYIVEVLRSHALEVQVENDTCISFGKIEHLCNRISAFGEINAENVISDLAPTPAVCGYPVENAHKYIEMPEHHSRHCYGGWIGMKEGTHSRFYVNLRSAFVEKRPDGSYRYNIFGGGGITKKSKPLTEWNEAQAKMEPLLSEIKASKLILGKR